MRVRVVETLAAIRSSRFDRPLSYDAGHLELAVGDIVRVPLGSREILAFVIAPVRIEEPALPLKSVIERVDAPRAFDEVGIRLAQFVAEHYVCTLGEALSAVVLASAVPRTVDRFVQTVRTPNPQRYASVPPRLIRLIWEAFPEGFAVEAFLRHPEARRTGDRAALLRYLQAIVRSGELRRERHFVDPRLREYRVKRLRVGAATIKGKKAEALRAFVADAREGVPRADALLAGFSSAVIARAISLGAIVEDEIVPVRERHTNAYRRPPFVATAEQAEALQRIAGWLDERTFREALLFGVTGSGKTFVYVEAIARVLAAGGRAIVLVPEISLTPQTARRFEEAFGQRVAVLHSALSERERFDAWQACARGEIDVVVGARSAVFAPLVNVRLLVVDEAHETSYKQDSVPRYHAVAVARERMRLEGGVLVLGSATPSLELFAEARAQRIEHVRLLQRATQQPLPMVHVVDMAEEFKNGNRRIFSAKLAQALAERVKRGEKSVLFVNRRGSASCMLCRTCGHVPKCTRCSVALAVHRSEGLLRCHYCDAQQPIPHACPQCGDTSVREFGIGTERVAEEVMRLYPTAHVIRMDSDTTTRIGDHARLLDAFGESGDVLVGTQMVAKGLDFPTVTLAGVVAADMGLHYPDFRASERSFALIMQVCGRSGRASAGEAIVQTYAPKNSAIVYAASHNYDGFAEQELDDRVAVGFPPARSLTYLGVIARSRQAAFAQATRYANLLRERGAESVLGPAPYPVARLNGEWRFRIAIADADGNTVRALVREHIVPLARGDHTTRLAINVDP